MGGAHHEQFDIIRQLRQDILREPERSLPRDQAPELEYPALCLYERGRQLRLVGGGGSQRRRRQRRMNGSYAPQASFFGKAGSVSGNGHHVAEKALARPEHGKVTGVQARQQSISLSIDQIQAVDDDDPLLLSAHQAAAKRCREENEVTHDQMAELAPAEQTVKHGFCEKPSVAEKGWWPAIGSSGKNQPGDLETEFKSGSQLDGISFHPSYGGGPLAGNQKQSWFQMKVPGMNVSAA